MKKQVTQTKAVKLASEVVNQHEIDTATGTLTHRAAVARLARMAASDPYIQAERRLRVLMASAHAAPRTRASVTTRTAAHMVRPSKKKPAATTKAVAEQAPKPAKVPKHTTVEQVTKALAKHRLLPAGTQELHGGVAHGYTRGQHAAVWVVGADGSTEWCLSGPGVADNTTGTALPTLEARVAELLPVAPAYPANTVAGVQALGGATKMASLLATFKADQHYGARMRLLKKLLSTSKVLAKDNTLAAFSKAFTAAVGAATGEPVADAKAFKTACQKIATAAAQYAGAVKRLEAKKIKDYLRQTLHQRIVGGPTPILEEEGTLVAAKGVVLPAKTPKGKRAKAAEAQELVSAKPDTSWAPNLMQNGHWATWQDVQAVGGDYVVDSTQAALIEHKNTGVVLLRLEKIGLNGAAPCVYNNGKEAALGYVTTERLASFNEIKDADLHTAARQLLSPIVTAVKVTAAAAAALTAVLNCKELTPMAKFEAPKTAAKRSTKATETASAPVKKAAKKAAAAEAKPAKKAAAAEAKPAKKAAKETATERAPRTSYAGQKIKALVKTHELRAGTWTDFMVTTMLASKTTDEASAAVAKSKEYGHKKPDFKWAVEKGFISLS